MIDENFLEPFKSQLISLGYERHPEETCGVFVKTSESQTIFIPTRNIASDRRESFTIDPQDYVMADGVGKIIAIFHTHTFSSLHNGKLNFSIADKACSEQMRIPWVLLSLPQEHFSIYHPNGYRAPFIGRPWKYGILDCFGLIKDVYESVGIYLKNYPRVREFEWNSQENWNLYEENYKSEGFIEIPQSIPPQKYDMILMKLQSSKTNHAGVMWSDRTFLQHLINRESSEDVYGGYWKSNTVKICRHQSLM